MRLLLLWLVAACMLAADNVLPQDRLWYDTPAKVWTEALPVGDGHLGAMVFGGIPTERIQFNESTLWTGNDVDMGAYQPFGDVRIDQPAADVAEYRRELDLDGAVARTRWRCGGVSFIREVIASHPARVLAVRFTADAPGRIGITVRLDDAHKATITADGPRLWSDGALDNGLRYRAVVLAVPEGGSVSSSEGAVVVRGADALTLLLSAGTSFANDPAVGWRGDPPEKIVESRLVAAAATPWPVLFETHQQDHRSLYRRTTINLGPAAVDLPTDRRIVAAAKAGTATDPGLDALFFAYGRYLMIASSRPGGLPANLQGIWNQDAKPAWFSGYTTNINVEMNYWLTGPTNLDPCTEPLVTWIRNLATVCKRSSVAALRPATGWMAYCTNNPMGGRSTWMLHCPGSAWLSQHLWSHYAFTGDRTFLAEVVQPMLAELCDMWLARLVPGPDGSLITPDGWSPEHGPVKEANGKVTLKEGNRDPQPGASYDQQIVYDLFTNYLDATAELGNDPDRRARVAAARNRILGPRIGRWGQLQEWMEDVDDPKDHHRHVSHLFALHPGRQINPLTTPRWAEAARVTLTARGDGGTGWSRAWKINFWARLGDGDHAHAVLRGLLGPQRGGNGGVYPNLFDAHPPFQIDGNFGATAAIAEMLVQSHVRDEAGYVVQLLPALPTAWSTGRACGLRVRGGGTLDLEWSTGRLTAATITADRDQTWTLRWGGQTTTVRLAAHAAKTWRPAP